MCRVILTVRLARPPSLAALSLTAPAPSRADTTLNTFPTTNDGASGPNDLGETFTAPADNVLTSFTYATTNTFPGLSLSIYQFIPSALQTVGGVLFTAAPTTGPTPITLNGIFGDAYTFDTGGLTLTAGQTYAALLNVPGNGGVGVLATDFTDAYAGGTLVQGTPGGTFQDFGQFSPVDAAFQATFTPSSVAAVPEPSTLAPFALAGLGLLGLTLRARRKNKPA